MPRLEHANLVVPNLTETLRFLQTAFPSWEVRGRGESTWFGVPRHWVHFGTETTYITLNNASVGKGRDLTGHTPGLAHLGFEVEDLEALRARMNDAGFPVAITPGDHPHRASLYFHAPSGVEFEFVEYHSESPRERNQYGGETSETVRH